MTTIDDVYAERDHLVAFLSRLYPAHFSEATDAKPGWQFVVCIHTPAGQLAWHIPDHELGELFWHLSEAPNDWDGHSTELKYSRLMSLVRTDR